MAKDRIEEIEEMLKLFCREGLSGKIIVKLFAGNIISVDRIIRTAARDGIKDNSGDIPIRLSLEVIDKLRQANMFGDVSFNYWGGRINWIEVNRIYKMVDINKFLLQEV